MISKLLKDYCAGDERLVANYDLALADEENTWVVFHRNLLTPVGRLRKYQLKNIGKFYNVQPDELTLLKREFVKKIERDNKLNTKPNACHTVFKFWSILHPDKLFSEITEQEFDEINRSVGRLRIIIRQMKSRCYSPTSQVYRWYGAKGVKVCKEWLDDTDNFVIWALKNGYIYYPEKRKGDQLSIDRIDPDGDYCPENCRWIPHRLNCQLTHRGVRHVRVKRGFQGEKNRRIAKSFPFAVNRGTSKGKYGFVDWEIVVRVKFNGDKNEFKRFLQEQEYTPQTIRKILNDV